ncbi:MAG: TraR/DksA C4-type zinc finger protein [Candidatus Omnitrophica bacterium]|nr:TraR/DksA C4-type zinc finger protein [Candidatus Omnitrophota bacterium]
MKPKIKMTKKEKEYFKKLLIHQREEILKEIKHISEDTLGKSQKDASGDISGYTYHMADVATDTYVREFSLGIATNEHKIIYELNDALKKLEEGTYGICEECKEPISKTRLKAIPYARLCIKCQQAKEKI